MVLCDEKSGRYTLPASTALPELVEKGEPTAEACPLAWPDIQALGKCAKLPVHEGANSPANIWGVVKKVRAYFAADPSLATRPALRKEWADSGTTSVDLALLYLVDVGELLSESNGKAFRLAAPTAPIAIPCPAKGCGAKPGGPCVGLAVGMSYHPARAAAAKRQPELPGQAGELGDADAKLEASILKLCRTARTPKAVQLAHKGSSAAVVSAAIFGLLGHGKLRRVGDKLQAAKT